MGSHFHRSHVSRGPPFHPGRSDLPSPVGGPDCPRAGLPDDSEAQALARIRPCRRRFARRLVLRSAGRRYPAQCPDAERSRRTARCREPLRPFEALPRRRRPQGRLGGRYPSVIARTGSCAGPNPSRRLRSPSPAGLRRLPPAPCWETALPGVISAVLARLSGPIPRGARSVRLPVSSRPAAASP